MNVMQLRRLIGTAEQGSFSEAARREGVSAQAVSKSLANLEEELGRCILMRAGRGVEPTPFGRALCDRARPVVEAFDDLSSSAVCPAEG